MEIFGPSSVGKTVLLCEIAGAVQRQGGQIKFHDPEGRLDQTFAKLFGLELKEKDYSRPNTPPEIFKPIRSWNPLPPNKIHGVFADSLAALASDLEMQDKKDEYSRRAKLFSQELRKTCRVLADKRILLCCSNQIRANVDAGPFEERFSSPGGQAIGFYASLRLRVTKGVPFQIKKDTVLGKNKDKKITRVIGIKTNVTVYKSTVWKPYRTADLYILFDYGIDDIRANLQFVKEQTDASCYVLKGKKLNQSMDRAIRLIEKDELELDLKEEVIDLWERLEEKFKQNRVPKRRF